MVVAGNQRQPLTLTIKFRSPAVNNNGDVPQVDHIDLIAGKINGLNRSNQPDYTKATNESHQSHRNLSAKRLEEWIETAIMSSITRSRIWTQACTSVSEAPTWQVTPLMRPMHREILCPTFWRQDNLGLDGAAEAWADLWFYSNPNFCLC